jgi:hypothetical protein
MVDDLRTVLGRPSSFAWIGRVQLARTEFYQIVQGRRSNRSPDEYALFTFPQDQSERGRGRLPAERNAFEGTDLDNPSLR